MFYLIACNGNSCSILDTDDNTVDVLTKEECIHIIETNKFYISGIIKSNTDEYSFIPRTVNAKLKYINPNIVKQEELLSKCNERIEKIQGTLKRHNSKLTKLEQKAKQYKLENNEREYKSLLYDINWCKDDIKNNTRKLNEASERLLEIKRRLQKEIGIQKIIEEQIPKSILIFIDEWGFKAFNWYLQESIGAELFLNRLDNENMDYDEKMKCKQNSLFSKTAFELAFKTPNSKIAYLERLIENEKQSKLQALVDRILKVTGHIVDSSKLTIGLNGEINGIIVGEKCKVKITTISAGGYNIQCYHYRVLVDICK